MLKVAILIISNFLCSAIILESSRGQAISAERGSNCDADTNRGKSDRPTLTKQVKSNLVRKICSTNCLNTQGLMFVPNVFICKISLHLSLNIFHRYKDISVILKPVLK